MEGIDGNVEHTLEPRWLRLRATGYGLFGVKRWKCFNECTKICAAKVIAPVRCSNPGRKPLFN